MKKKYRSIIKQVVLWPLVIMLFLSLAVFGVAMINYNQAVDLEMESRLAVMRSGYAQLDNIMKQCEYTFTSYFTRELNSGILLAMPEEAEEQDYFLAVSDSVDYLRTVIYANEEVDGIFLYFPRIKSLNFRGTTKKEVNDTISELLTTGQARYNQWHLIEMGGKWYIIYIAKKQEACCGCWMDVGQVLSSLGIQNSQPSNGSIYAADVFGENSLEDSVLHDAVAGENRGDTKFHIGRETYVKYEVHISSHAVYMGMLMEKGNLFSRMPLLHRMIFLLALLGFFSTIAVVVWMNSNISRPIFMLKKAMDRFGSGDVEYRLQERNGKIIDEFDLLGQSLNHMMDQLNELEYHLYETRLREQDIKMKYISQQIRPHFILNALNVIYTYREDEFPLVKKMVIYLVNYFRYIVNLRVDFVELEKEFRHVENYLNIQKERTQNQIDFFVEWEQAVSDALIPPLIIQTFVENSIKYAVSEKKLYVIVHAAREEDRLKISISDTGQGYQEETLQEIRQFLDTRVDDGKLGVGIVNAVERMDILYHGDIILKVGNSSSGGALTEIILPFIRNEREREQDVSGNDR